MFCEKTQKWLLGRPELRSFPFVVGYVPFVHQPLFVFADATPRQMKKLINKMATPMLSKITMATRMGAEPCNGRRTRGEPVPGLPPPTGSSETAARVVAQVRERVPLLLGLQ